MSPSIDWQALEKNICVLSARESLFPFGGARERDESFGAIFGVVFEESTGTSGRCADHGKPGKILHPSSRVREQICEGTCRGKSFFGKVFRNDSSAR